MASPYADSVIDGADVAETARGPLKPMKMYTTSGLSTANVAAYARAVEIYTTADCTVKAASAGGSVFGLAMKISKSAAGTTDARCEVMTSGVGWCAMGGTTTALAAQTVGSAVEGDGTGKVLESAAITTFAAGAVMRKPIIIARNATDKVVLLDLG